MGLNTTQQRWVKSAALSSGYAYSVLAALVDKESNGQFFWKVDGMNRLALNIEPHRFYKYIGLLAPDKLKEAVASGLASKKRGAIKVPSSYSGRYAMLDRMIALHKEAAYQSVSFGVGQIMGENYDEIGYASAEQMYAAAGADAGAAQIKQIIEFIATKPALVTAMHAEDTKGIALYYNGPAYRENHYDTELDRLIRVYNGDTSAELAIDTSHEEQDILALGYASVAAFQTENGLKPDGVIGQITKAKITEVQAARAKVVAAPAKKVAQTATVATVAVTTATGTAVVLADASKDIGTTLKTIEPVITVVKQVSSFGPTVALVMICSLIVGGISYALWKRTRSASA